MTFKAAYDVVIVGGGINGAGIARDAALRGLSVLLCEKNDLASGTSSASTKLIHGGLRYLAQGDFSLVAEALREREILLRIAPHVVEPLAFLYPQPKGYCKRAMIRTGLWCYDHLAGRTILPRTECCDLTTLQHSLALQSDYKAAYCYYDGLTNDARLVVLNALAAHQQGAEIRTHTQVLEAQPHQGQWQLTVRNNSSQAQIRARVLINAAGPWGSALSEQWLQRPLFKTTLVKGSHLVVKQLYQAHHAYILPQPDGRFVFVIPYEEAFHLIGTTEQIGIDPHSKPRISDEEIDYLFAAVERYTHFSLQRASIVHSFSGWRVLSGAQADPKNISREVCIDLHEAAPNVPLITVLGGKLTSFRAISAEVVDRLHPYFQDLTPCQTDKKTLPGGDLGQSLTAFIQTLKNCYPFLPERLCRRYAKTYGTLCLIFLKNIQTVAELGRCLGADFYEIEQEYLRGYEWAQTEEDCLWRRTRLGLHF